MTGDALAVSVQIPILLHPALKADNATGFFDSVWLRPGPAAGQHGRDRGPETTSICPGFSAWPVRGFQRLRCCISTLKRLATMYSESPFLTLYCTGDNLTLIAKANKVDVHDLQRWNKLNGQQLKVGQTLVMQDTRKLVAKAV
jgi:hypothetical protein